MSDIYRGKKIKQNRFFWGEGDCMILRSLRYKVERIFSERVLNNATIQVSVCSLTFDVLTEIPAMLNYGESLQQVRAKQLFDMSWLLSYDNRRSPKGLNANSLYGETYHQMFTLQIKEEIQILNGNNNFFQNEMDLVGKTQRKRLRDRHQGHAI